jgi:hypothetical protein
MQDRSKVAKMTEKMKTVCVGRYLVDVPAEAEVSLSRAMVAGFEIDMQEESQSAFQERVAARELELQARGGAGGGKGGLAEARDLAIPGMLGRMLVFGRTRGSFPEGERRVEDEWVQIEAHAHIEGLSFSLTAKYADEARTRVAEALLARLRLRGPDEVPAMPGFCIDRAIFAEPLPEHKNEHMVMHVGLPGHPDFALALASLAGANGGPGLLERNAQTDTLFSADELLRVTKLRKGKRSINGLDGEEVLERVRELNFTTGFGFNWEARGTEGDLLKPYLSLEMQTGTSERPGGKPVDSSLHEDAVVALWDTISSSIRLRPNGPPPPSAAPPGPPSPGLGTIAQAGEVCPQSGWWQCSEGGPGLDVHGGQVQYIRKGERMPQALLLPKQSLWQKVRRIQPSVESPRLTAWKLVDKRVRPRRAPAVALAQPGAPALGQDLSAGEPQVVVGTYVRTGEPCPASGWWRCEEQHALDGTRWFARGSLLPPATFQVPPGVFGRSSGPEVIQRRSVWQLVRQVEAAELAQTMPQARPDAGRAVGGPPALA